MGLVSKNEPHRRGGLHFTLANKMMFSFQASPYPGPSPGPGPGDGVVSPGTPLETETLASLSQVKNVLANLTLLICQ